MNLSLRASTRVSGLVVQEAGNETLVYDLENHRALNLNGTASHVWRELDGTQTAEGIARKTGIPVELVLLSIDEFESNGLLNERVETGVGKTATSRRKMLMDVASAVAIPVVIGIVAPRAAHAQSCVCAPILNEQACIANADCTWFFDRCAAAQQDSNIC